LSSLCERFIFTDLLIVDSFSSNLYTMSLLPRFSFLFPLAISLFGAFQLAAAPLNVLFLGDSFTHHPSLPSNVPGYFSNIVAGSSFQSPVVDYNAPGGWTLDDHLGYNGDNSSLTKIAKGGWDYVVIQDQSEWPAHGAVDPYDLYLFENDVSTLYDLVKASSPHATVVLYETWAWQESYIESQPSDEQYYIGTNAATMQERVNFAYQDAYQTLLDSGSPDVRLAQVGMAREINRTNGVNMNMFSDNTHPNFAGSYLASLVMYETIYGAAPQSTTYTGSLSGSDAAYIQGLAAQVVSVPEPSSCALALGGLGLLTVLGWRSHRHG
jgi:hypothetical protein